MAIESIDKREGESLTKQLVAIGVAAGFAILGVIALPELGDSFQTRPLPGKPIVRPEIEPPFMDRPYIVPETDPALLQPPKTITLTILTN